MNEIQENGIKIYTGETDDDEEDNADIKELKVSPCSRTTFHTYLYLRTRRQRYVALVE